MIEKVVVKGYRRFAGLDVTLAPGLNVVIGDNESGKSTLLEAIGLALTGRVNGRWAVEELNPHWFHQPNVSAFFSGESGAPEILIELYLRNDDPVQRLRGVHNSAGLDTPGVSVRVIPSPEYEAEFRDYMASRPPPIVPVEFYDVDWRDFGDKPILRRPKELAAALIDTRTIRSTSGVDHHTREMLSEHLDSKERAAIAVAHRRSRQGITEDVLAPINKRIAAANANLHDRPVGLQMDQSARTSWEGGVVPQVDGIPFAMTGQGQQASLKVALAMSRTAGASTYVLVEEPENHLSHTTLTRLLARLETLAGPSQQLIATTHSSYVLNRLGLDNLLLLHEGRQAKLTALDPGTVSYFRKLAGYDTLRLVLARRLVLVEGPSDAMVLERAFRDATGQSPTDAGIDIVSMGGLTFARALELCAALDRDALAIQDNDGQTAAEVTAPVERFLEGTRRVLIVGQESHGRTLEPQLIVANDESTLRRVLGLSDKPDLAKWMRNNKTEAALRILDSAERIKYPTYIAEAIEHLR